MKKMLYLGMTSLMLLFSAIGSLSAQGVEKPLGDVKATVAYDRESFELFVPAEYRTAENQGFEASKDGLPWVVLTFDNSNPIENAVSLKFKEQGGEDYLVIADKDATDGTLTEEGTRLSISYTKYLMLRADVELGIKEGLAEGKTYVAEFYMGENEETVATVEFAQPAAGYKFEGVQARMVTDEETFKKYVPADYQEQYPYQESDASGFPWLVLTFENAEGAAFGLKINHGESAVEFQSTCSGVGVISENGEELFAKVKNYVMFETAKDLGIESLDAESLSVEFYVGGEKVQTVAPSEEPAEEPDLTPVFTPASGTEVEEGTEITITAVEGAVIYYKQGATLADISFDNIIDAVEYAEDAKPVITKGQEAIKAVVITEDDDMSEITDAVYTIKAEEPEPADTVANPVFNVPSGEVEKGAKVTITTATEDAKILYTTNGDNPKEAGKMYTEALTIDTVMTIKAVAFLGEDTTAIVSATYTIKAEEPIDTVATPVFSVASGKVVAGTKVALSTMTEGAKIYYTIDGTEPSAKSTEYIDSIVINTTMTIKAIAVKGEAVSKVATAEYEVTVSNGVQELAGVTVYPNPNDGQFTLNVPVRATVEIFSAAGMQVNRMEVAAGISAIRLNHSGIYFVRVSAQGQVSIKRVIVR